MRINVIGTSGSGKSTLSQRLAKELNIPHIEMDALFWRENWTHISHEELCEVVDKALSASDSWVIDGNYKRTEPIKWKRRSSLLTMSASATNATTADTTTQEAVKQKVPTSHSQGQNNDSLPTVAPPHTISSDGVEPTGTCTGTLSKPAHCFSGNDGDEVIVAWVDMSFARTMFQAITRAISRLWWRTELWGAGNIETFGKTFFSRDSIIWFTIQTYQKNRARHLELIEKKAAGAPEYQHIRFFRLQSRAEVDAFVSLMVREKKIK